MSETFEEYPVFTITDKNGNPVEMAVVDEFEYEKKSYVVGAVIQGDTIDMDGLYIYRAKVQDDELITEKITNATEYEKVSKAYLAI